MLAWLTWQLYEVMYGVQVSGAGLDVLRVIGFIELLIEVVVVAVLIIAIIQDFIERKEKEKK